MTTSDISYLFKCLSDVSRVTIIKSLFNSEELCGCDLLQVVDCKQATLSHHMNILVESNLVSSRKDGKWVYYKLNKEMLCNLLDFFN